MNLVKLSTVLLLERGSVSLKPSETSNIEYTPEIRKLMRALVDDLRKTKWPDKGFSFNLCNAVRLNEDWQKLIVDLVDYVTKKNIINMDIWVSKKPSDSVKKITAEVKKTIKENHSNAVRIRADRPKTRPHMYKALITAAGLVLVGLAQWFEMDVFKLWSAEFKSNVPQLIAACVTAAPWLLGPLMNKFLTPKAKTESE